MPTLYPPIPTGEDEEEVVVSKDVKKKLKDPQKDSAEASKRRKKKKVTGASTESQRDAVQSDVPLGFNPPYLYDATAGLNVMVTNETSQYCVDMRMSHPRMSTGV